MAEENESKGPEESESPASPGQAPEAEKGSEPQEQTKKEAPEKTAETGEQAKTGRKKPAKKPKAGQIQGFIRKNMVVWAAALSIAIVAIAAFAAMQPNQASVEDFWNGAGSTEDKGIAKMIIITSNRCPGCEANNSLEKLFNMNGIDYAVSSYEESSDDGKSFIQVTRPKKLPAFIIEEASLTDRMLVSTASGIAKLKDVLHFYVDKGHGTYEEGIFTFPELGLDGVIKPKLLLQESCGNKENILIQLFADPYDPNTISTSRDFENLRSLAESQQDINFAFIYNYLPTYSQLLEEYLLDTFGGKPETVRGNIQEPAEYLICANDVFGTTGFNPMQKQVYATYCEIDENTLATGTTEPLVKCGDSNHFNVLLTGDEMVEAAKKAEVYGNQKFNTCLYNLDQTFTLETMLEIAKRAGIERTPTLLLNCQYEVPMESALNAICTINSEFRYCKRE